jgi:predicted helicase
VWAELGGGPAEAPEGFDLSLFYYIYAVLHLPEYRRRYKDQLKIDFPRIPTPKQIAETNLAKNSPLEGWTAKPDGVVVDTDKHQLLQLFQFLVENGNKLINLHLLGQNPFEPEAKTWFKNLVNNSEFGVKIDTKPKEVEDKTVGKTKYDPQNRRVYFNSTQYFSEISEELWNYHVGGYQVLDKWLKSHKDRTLSIDDLKHFRKICVSLQETIKKRIF